LPAPVDLDLPAPVESLDLPAPVDLDLPAPVESLDLPAPVDLDLPAPLDDLPAPVDDLPTPVDDLPMPAENLPMPAGGVAGFEDSLPSVPHGPAPGPAGELELDIDQGGDINRTIIPDVSTAGDAGANLVDAHDQKIPKPGGRMAHMASPAPKQSSRKAPPKPVLFGALGAIVLLLGLGGAYAAGVFGGDDEGFEPKSLGGKTGGDEKPVKKLDPGEVAERSDGVLDMLGEDTPASYTKALASSEALGDRVGQAEAALLFHYRYGPDRVHLGQAQALLEDYSANKEPYVLRVMALRSLSGGELAEAEKLLTGDDPRSKLYLSWIRMEQGRAQDALDLAKAVEGARSGDQGASLTAHLAGLELDPAGGLTALRTSAEANPKHPLYQQSLVRALLNQGQLAEAAERGRSLDSNRNASADHQATILALRATIAETQGNYPEAVRLEEQSIALAPEAIGAQVARLETLLASSNETELRPDLDAFLRDHPKNRPVLLISAQAHVETGQGDKALATLEKIENGAAHAEVHEIKGNVLAMRMALDDARKSYAKARELDPLRPSISIAESNMLARGQQLDAALLLLEEHKGTIVADANRANSTAGRATMAALEIQRARLLEADGRREDAAKAVEAALSSDPTSNEARLVKGKLMMAMGRRAEAEAILTELHDRTGGYPGLTGPVGAVYLRRGELEKLDGLLGKHLENAGASEEILLTGALLRLRQGKTDPAIALTETVLARDPSSWNARLVKTQILIEQGDYEAALMEINQAQATSPNAEIELWKGKTLDYNGQSKEAEKRYRKAMEIDPSLLEAKALYGRVLAYNGAAKQAIELLTPVVEATDEYAYARVALGRAKNDLGKRDEAVAEFKKAQQLDPKLFEAFYWEGRLQSDRTKHAAAVKALTRATEVSLGNEGSYLVDAYRRLGDGHKAMGKASKAKAAYGKYLELAPAGAPGRAAVQREIQGL
jgi:tetratricopeptide (TPR) repeat protein